ESGNRRATIPSSAPVFHGKPPVRDPKGRPRHHSGRRPGTPTRRGQRSPGGPADVRMATLPPSLPRRSGPTNPKESTPSLGHRVGSGPPGGSLTASRPPSPRKPTAHSAVVPGAPNP